jgi:hypothetical protein
VPLDEEDLQGHAREMTKPEHRALDVAALVAAWGINRPAVLPGVAIVLFAPAYSRLLDTIGYAEGLFWSFGWSGQTVIDPVLYLRTLQGLILQEWPIAAVCLVAVGLAAARDVERRMSGFIANAGASMQLTALLEAGSPECRVVPYYAATDLAYALKYGLDYARIRDEPYGAVLEETYGPRVFFRIWSREFQTWRAMTTVEEVMASDPCVVLRGSIRGVLDADPKLKALVTDECTLGGETLYVIGRRCQNLVQPRRY